MSKNLGPRTFLNTLFTALFFYFGYNMTSAHDKFLYVIICSRLPKVFTSRSLHSHMLTSGKHVIFIASVVNISLIWDHIHPAWIWSEIIFMLENVQSSRFCFRRFFLVIFHSWKCSYMLLCYSNSPAASTPLHVATC